MGKAEAGRSMSVLVRAGNRGMSWPMARLIVGSGELTVRSALERWIPTQSASRETVGEILVDRRIKVTLPVLRWQRLDILNFEDPGSPFAGLTLTLARRKRIVEELRARGYSVTDRRH